jgi:hypothetical protein
MNRHTPTLAARPTQTHNQDPRQLMNATRNTLLRHLPMLIGFTVLIERLAQAIAPATAPRRLPRPA